MIQLISKNAEQDNLNPFDYRDIYQEVRGYDAATDTYAVSLDKFVALLQSTYSKAQWSKYHSGAIQLTRQMRNELRQAVGLQLLPLQVADAVAIASPDASVWRVGQEQPEHVIMVGSAAPVTLQVNGDVRELAVTKVTRAARKRRRYARPAATMEQDARRRAAGATWGAVIEAGLQQLEAIS